MRWETALATAVIGAGLWYFVLKPKEEEGRTTQRARDRNQRARQTPRQQVSRKSSKRQRVTCNWKALVGASDELAESVVSLMRALADTFEVIVIVPDCTSDDTEKSVNQTLARNGFVQPCPITQTSQLHNVFCEKEESITHIVRRLSPDVHIDVSKNIVDTLQPHINAIVLVSEEVEAAHQNVLVTEKLSVGDVSTALLITK
eukprot:m.115363 g.115363  ORF g.115363 m.115363 type:complete len:202 (+) comp14199_c0_seq7:240-845(+)